MTDKKSLEKLCGFGSYLLQMIPKGNYIEKHKLGGETTLQFNSLKKCKEGDFVFQLDGRRVITNMNY